MKRDFMAKKIEGMKYIRTYENMDFNNKMRKLYSNVCYYFDVIFSNIEGYESCFYSSDNFNCFFLETKNTKGVYDILEQDGIKVVKEIKTKIQGGVSGLEVEIFLTDEQILKYSNLHNKIKKYNI